MYTMIMAVIRHEYLDAMVTALKKKKNPFTFGEVKGFGKETHLYAGDIHTRIRLEIVVDEKDAETVTRAILEHVPKAATGSGILVRYRLEEFIDFSEIS